MRTHEAQQISATELARNMAQTIDDVRISRNTVLITKGTRVIAQLAPPPLTGLSMQGLIRLLAYMPSLNAGDAQRFSEDLETIRKNTPLAANPWD